MVKGPGSVVGIATGYELEGPGIKSWWGARFSAPVQTSPGAHPASCTMGTGSFPEVKNGRGMTLTPHPLLVPWSWNSRAIPLLPLCAVRFVQSLSACTRVHFTFFFTKWLNKRTSFLFLITESRLKQHWKITDLTDYHRPTVHYYTDYHNVRTGERAACTLHTPTASTQA
jgi:hypothetical protein